MKGIDTILSEFIRLYKAEFHESLTEDEAELIWTRVMDLYFLLYGPQDPSASGTHHQAPTEVHPA